MSTQLDKEITLKHHPHKTQIIKIVHSALGLFLWVQSLQSRVGDNTGRKINCHAMGLDLNGDNLIVVERFWTVSKEFTALMSIITSQQSCFIVYKLVMMLLPFFGQQGRREGSRKENQTRLKWKRGRKFLTKK